MRTYPSSTAVETPPVSNRRQPLRQARANPTRGTTTSTQPVGSVNDPNNAAPKANTGFFPAITHFTDAITALPKEMTRNYTMLKEVDAKIYGPEELLHCLVAEVRKAPIPPHKPSATPQILQNATSSAGSVPELAKRRSAASTPIELPPNQHSELHEPNSADLPRRHLIRDLRNVINEMLGTLDEKNHVISTAMDELEKQLGRCDTSYPQIAKEVSEEARFGSANHWAYTAKAAEKKGSLAGERTRRETASNHQTANLATNHDMDGVAARSEARREALAARKNKNPPLDSDFDDAKLSAQNSGRKPSANLKTRKVTEPGQTVNGTGVGLGIANASSVPPPSKRRKIEKPSFGSAGTAFPMERAMSSVYAPSNGTLKTTAISPRATPVVEVAKKKGRATVPVNGSTRRRANTNASTANSPSMASSPVAGTFNTAKDSHRRSPAVGMVHRAQPSRTRQNSAQSMLPDVRNRPSSATSNKPANGNGTVSTSAEVEKISALISKGIGEIKTTVKEVPDPKSELPVEEVSAADGAADLRGGSISHARTNERSFKREETENGVSKTRADRPPSISISTRGSGKLSKTSTPQNPSFSEPPPRRQPRTTEPPIKRSHKKGAGLAAQLAAAAAAEANHDEDGSSMQGDDDDDDESEPRYCYCNQVSYGEMVACDMDTCPREWFHLDCVGLTKAPKGNTKWFCDECKENLKRGKGSTASVGNGRS